MKRLLRICLACLLMFSSSVTICAKDIHEEGSAESWRYHEGQLMEDVYGVMTLADPYHPNATLTGIDVSEHQGQINWEKVKVSGIDFAIIRCGYGMDMESQDDKWFIYNATECERVGMPYGVYLYSYATNTTRAASEAAHTLRLLKGRSLSYPVYFDMEDASTIIGNTPAERQKNLANIAKTFCNAIEDAGYPVGVYANLNWWTNYLTDSCFNQWYRWVAQYNSSCDYTGEYAMWQYTSSGSVNGISGRVDMNFLIGQPKDHGAISKTVVSREVVEAPTCEKDGILRVTYSDNTYDDVVIPSAGHSYEKTVILPKCKSMGYTVYDCKFCDDTYQADEVEELGHSFGEYASNEDGTMTRECGVCHEKETIDDPNVSIRIYGATRYETSFKIANELKEKVAVEQFDSVIIANGKNFADALAGSYLAAKKSAPIIITDGKNIDDVQNYISANVKKEGTIYLLGGVAVVSDDVVKGLDGYDVQRLWGDNRYETNLAILMAAGVENEEILVATGKNFADSLSASASKKPILLVDKVLSNDQKDFLSSLNGNKMMILGGENAVSTKLEDELYAYGGVSRIGGTTRYETSIMIAEQFYEEPTIAVLAYAQNFPDGLCGGALASSLDAPLILTKTGSEMVAKVYVEEKGITKGVVLGGPSLIDDASVKRVFNITQDNCIIVK